MSVFFKGTKFTSSGVSSYAQLTGKPKINGTTLLGNIEIGDIREVVTLPVAGIRQTTLYKRGDALYWWNGTKWVELSAEAAADLGTAGNASTPVFTENGVIKVASRYAGGTKVSLNGADLESAEASVYAPAAAGTAGQILTSAGTGAPEWKSAAVDGVPTGTIAPFLGGVAPDGWLICQGGLVSRTKYQALFNMIGTTYGSGDGSTTFKLPDLRGRFLEGAATSGTGHLLHNVVAAGLPNISGYAYSRPCSGGHWNVDYASGAIRTVKQAKELGGKWSNQIKLSGGSWDFDEVSFLASRSNTIYGASTTVQPKSVCINYIVKY